MRGERQLSRILLEGVFNNFWLKLISLLFALGFYAFIHSDQNAQRVIRVKLVTESPPENIPRKLMTNIPPTVDVTLTGPESAIEQLNGDDYAITLNLQAATDIPELRLVPEMIAPDLPPRVTVDRIFPSRLAIRFEDIVTRMVPVQVPRTGEPGAGMEEQGTPVIEPVEVKATGIESAVSTIQFASTEPFDLSGLMEGTFTRDLRLYDPPENVEYDVRIVRATVEIVQKRKQREFDNIKVEVLGLPRATTNPPVVHLIVSGPADIVERLRSEAIVPRVEPLRLEVDTSQPGSANLRVMVDLPPQLDVTIQPEFVVVKWGAGPGR
jgi:YbbR domain-containing protein